MNKESKGTFYVGKKKRERIDKLCFQFRKGHEEGFQQGKAKARKEFEEKIEEEKDFYYHKKCDKDSCNACSRLKMLMELKQKIKELEGK